LWRPVGVPSFGVTEDLFETGEFLGVLDGMNASTKRNFIRSIHPGLVLLTSALLLLGGCVVEPVRVRPAVYVEPAPLPSGEVVVMEAPPPPQEEVVVVQPSPAHVWIHGYWAWHGDRHVWVSGRWELPPRPGVAWVEPRWEHRDRGYVFVAGSWREGPAVVHERVEVRPAVNVGLNFVVQAPPPPRREVIVERERPSRDHVWIRGYWVWREGRHVWINGRWERPPHPHAVWIEPRWERRDRGYVFIEGFWR